MVADAAAVTHLADHVCVAYGMKAVGRDHIAIEVHTLVRVFVIALREGGDTTRQQEQY